MRPHNRIANVVVATVLFGGLGVGVYEVVHQNTGTTGATGHFCTSLGEAMQMVYDQDTNLTLMDSTLNKNAKAVGGQIWTDTQYFEVTVANREIKAADYYLTLLAQLCSTNGSPVPALVTTVP